jgi:OmcA/MtrC family decaheme c-type cytochrome
LKGKIEVVGKCIKREFLNQGWSFFFENEGLKMKSKLVRMGLTALMIGALAGCGGASIGLNGTTGGGTNASGVPVTVTNGATSIAALSASAFQALQPVVTVQSVTIAPMTGTYPNLSGGTVVKFKVTDQNGTPLVGLGGQSNNPAQTNVTHVPTNYDISFTLAKLVPGTAGVLPGSAGEPSRWINYGVTKLAATSTPASAVVTNEGVAWTGSYPTNDSNGTIVDNGDGTYQYTFLRDVTQAQTIIQALPATYTVGSSNYNTADLDIAHLNYDPTATHRLGILLTGSQPNTGSAFPGGVAPAGGPNAVPLVYTVSQAYDFVPNGGAVTVTRNIVDARSCDACHDNVSQKRGLGHVSTSSATNGIPPGAYVGRNDPQLCVTCHNDQVKFGFANVTTGTNADGSPAYTGPYYRTASGVSGLDQAAFVYPRMIHQTHMGNQLVYTGYNLNGHVGQTTNPVTGAALTAAQTLANANCATAATAGANAAQCLNLVGLPQDQRNCTRCHTGTAITSAASNTPSKLTVVTTDGDNWKNAPSQLACGACHDGINFVKGTGITLTDRDTDLAAKAHVGTHASGHAGGTQPDNSGCTVCHRTGGMADIAVVHETPYDSLNSVGTQSGVDTLAYSISKVTVNASGQPVIVFSLSVNGTAVTSLAAATTVMSSSSGQVMVDPNFAPIPANPELVSASNLSFYAAYAVPQDGIANPADFNVSASASLANILVTTGSPKAGSLSNTLTSGVYAADSSGNFTVTLTGDTVGQPATGTCKQVTTIGLQSNGNCVNPSPIIIPANASMVTGAIIGGLVEKGIAAYPYTAATLGVGNTGGLGVTGQIAKLAASTCSQTGITTAQATACKTARRVATSAALCNNCHDRLGTDPAFHTISGTLAGAGYRNDPTACNICHNANRTDSGWPVDISSWVHGIHGASKRTVPWTASADFTSVLYPGQLKDCNQCHLPNTVNFGSTGGFDGAGANPNLLSNMLWSYTATGSISTPSAASFAVSNPQTPASTNTGTSPYVTNITTTATKAATGYAYGGYGNAFAFANASAVLGAYTPSSAQNTAIITQSAVVVTNPLGQSVAADPAALVNSPISSACSACHTDQNEWNHMKSNGGVLYGQRGTAALVNGEACLTCHGQGTIMDAAVVHQQQ